MLFPVLACLFFFFYLIFQSSFAYEDPRASTCSDSTSIYTPNSAFSTNLALALTTLQKSTAATGFSATTSAPKDSVTALALCRASISSLECQSCVDAAASGIRSKCPNGTSAQVWYTLCMLRYSDINFLNQSDNTIAFMIVDVRDAPNQEAFDPKVKALLQNLSYTAGVSDKRSAVGRTSMVGDRNIYGYVDCTRDINGGDCTTCLSNAIAARRGCCLGKWAGWVGTPTCNIQFNMDPVHDDWINPPYVNTDDVYPSPVSPNATEPGVSGGGGLKIGVSVVVAVTVVAIVVVVVTGATVVVVGVGVVRRRKKRERVSERRRGSEESAVVEEIEARSFLYDFNVLAAATDNFSTENQLGEGGFGTVYRGKMASGEEVAVKKLRANSSQGVREFSNEVRLLHKMQHRNLVQLLGCCVHGTEMMLVYEYLLNKSLDHFLFDKSKSALLDWTKRWNIISGVARGLLYLHEDSQVKTIHRDIKASNILLDEQMNPKISDFGIAKLFSDSQSRLRTGRIVGTFGYMAPEYAIRGMVSTKGDVFSFGVLMLEIISGRRNYDLQYDDGERELLNLTRRLDREGRQTELVDLTIGTYPLEVICRCIKIALLCCQESVQLRPTMSLALTLLTSHSTTLPAAGRVAFQGGRDNTLVDDQSLEVSDISITISLANGR